MTGGVHRLAAMKLVNVMKPGTFTEVKDHLLFPCKCCDSGGSGHRRRRRDVCGGAKSRFFAQAVFHVSRESES